MTVRRLLTLMILLGIALPIGAVMGRDALQESQAQMQAMQIAALTTYTVAYGDVEQAVSGLGAMEADETISLSFQISGTVDTVYVETGDYVLQGDILAILDNGELALQHEQALLALDRAELDLQDVLEPPSESELEVAQANITSAQGSLYSAATQVSAADIEAAELRVAQAQSRYDGLVDARGLRSPDTDEELAQIEADLGAASFELERARLDLENLRASASGGSIAEASNRVRLAELQYEQILEPATEYAITRGEIAVERAELSLTQIENSYAKTILVAPVNGVISAINIEEGQAAVAGQGILTIADRDPLQLVAQIDETDIDLVEVGMEAFVMLDALPDVNLPATVTEIALLGNDENGVVTYDVRFELLGADTRAREGMTAEAFILLDTRDDVLVVPNTFVIRTGNGMGRVSVLTSEDTIEERTIEIGLVGRENTEIFDGLRLGDTVVLEANEG